MQTKRQAAFEVSVGTFTGFVGSWIITMLVIRFTTFDATIKTTIITALCTVWSFARGYTLRRYFNRKHSRV